MNQKIDRMKEYKLLTPKIAGYLETRNRIVMAPMTGIFWQKDSLFQVMTGRKAALLFRFPWKDAISPMMMI